MSLLDFNFRCFTLCYLLFFVCIRASAQEYAKYRPEVIVDVLSPVQDYEISPTKSAVLTVVTKLSLKLEETWVMDHSTLVPNEIDEYIVTQPLQPTNDLNKMRVCPFSENHLHNDASCNRFSKMNSSSTNGFSLWSISDNKETTVKKLIKSLKSLAKVCFHLISGTAKIVKECAPWSDRTPIVRAKLPISPMHIAPLSIDVTIEGHITSIVRWKRVGRNLRVYGTCHAKVQFKYPLNGQVLHAGETLEIEAGIHTSRETSGNLKHGTFCVLFDWEHSMCSKSGSFSVRNLVTGRHHIKLRFEHEHEHEHENGPNFVVCDDEVIISVNTPIVNSMHGLLLSSHGFVPVDKVFHEQYLPLRLVQQLKSTVPRSCNVVNPSAVQLQALLLQSNDVYVVDSWSGKINWETYISQEWTNLFHAMQRVLHWQVISSVEFESLQTAPSAVVFFEFPDTPTFQTALRWKITNNAKLFLFCDDLHGCNSKGKSTTQLSFILSEITAFLGTYSYLARYYFHNLLPEDLPIIWLPHAVSSEFLFDSIHSDPIARILLVGALDSKFYPLRNWASKMSFEGRLPIDVHGHPGYDSVNTAFHTCLFGELMHSYLAVFVDTSRLQYVVAKVLEVMATGALLLVNSDAAPLLHALGMNNGEHYLGYDPLNPKRAILEALNPSQRQRIDFMRSKAQRLVLKHHTIEHRIWQWFDSVCLPGLSTPYVVKERNGTTVKIHGCPVIDEELSVCLGAFNSIQRSTCCSPLSITRKESWVK